MRIVVITPFEEREWRWLAAYFSDCPWEWEFHNLNLFGKNMFQWLKAAYTASLVIREGDLVITHSPYMTLYLSLMLRLRRIRVQHIAFSFNHGNGRFFKGARLWAARVVLRDVNAFAVYSRAEVPILCGRNGLDSRKFMFQHWAVAGIPEAAECPIGESNVPRVACMGRNNRDFGMFLKAVQGLRVEGVVVCPRGALDGLTVPSNVKVFHQLSSEQCQAILASSICSVVPIRDASTGAAHIAIVSALQSGIPVVATELPVLDDYLIDGFNGLRFSQRDSSSLRNAICRLIESPSLCRQLARNSREFAESWLSEPAAVRSVKLLISRVVNSGTVVVEP